MIRAFAVLVLTAPVVSCAEECTSVRQLLAESAASTFSFIATSSPDVVSLPVFVPCERLGAGAGVTVAVHATERGADEDLLLAFLDSEPLATVTAETDVATLQLDDDRNLLICTSGNRIANTSCAFATPGPDRKVAAVLSISESSQLSVASDGSVLQESFLTNVVFADGCVAAARRDCAPPTVTLEECATVAAARAGCGIDRGTEVDAAFGCEAACAENCSDSCGILDSVR